VKEIRIHGRGGQGNVTAGELIAVAAFEDGKYSQAFPAFGSERMGSPVRAFVRISDQKIRTRSQVLRPDYIIVQDPTLLAAENVLEGLKRDGMAIVNSDKSPEELGLDTAAKVVTVPAFQIAREVIGRPVPNTVLMGSFAAATGLVSLQAIERSIRHRFRGEVADRNVEAARKAYDHVNGQGN
jgi:pyruvate ferredoxin oxidoreductase gamma subunit